MKRFTVKYTQRVKMDSDWDMTEERREIVIARDEQEAKSIVKCKHPMAYNLEIS